MEQQGIKHDKGKPRWSLLPWEVIELVVLVLSHGASKYGDYNWQKVEQERYWSALFRHLVAHKKGELLDKETNLPHLAHALTNLIFITYFEITSKSDDQPTS